MAVRCGRGGPRDPQDVGCPSCSARLDDIGHLAHLKARGTTLAVVSRAPLAKIEPFKKRMGWTFPWYSSQGSDFNYARGTEQTGGTNHLLDLTALGRQEDWEEPKGRATGLGAKAGSEALRYHDEYDT